MFRIVTASFLSSLITAEEACGESKESAVKATLGQESVLLQTAKRHSQYSSMNEIGGLIKSSTGGASQQRIVPTIKEVCDTSKPNLGLCEGNCDSDSDCGGLPGLKCWHREGMTPVVGCSGAAVAGNNYCYYADGPPLVNRTCHIEEKCGLCEGQCLLDDDCEGDLMCFHRPPFNATLWVPGCTSGGDGDIPGGKYCFRPQKHLVASGGTGCSASNPCSECQGNCQDDSDCAGDLKCYQRDGGAPVPGCEGGGGDAAGVNYCVRECESDWDGKWTGILSWGANLTATATRAHPDGTCHYKIRYHYNGYPLGVIRDFYDWKDGDVYWSYGEGPWGFGALNKVFREPHGWALMAGGDPDGGNHHWISHDTEHPLPLHCEKPPKEPETIIEGCP